MDLGNKPSLFETVFYALKRFFELWRIHRKVNFRLNVASLMISLKLKKKESFEFEITVQHYLFDYDFPKNFANKLSERGVIVEFVNYYPDGWDGGIYTIRFA